MSTPGTPGGNPFEGLPIFGDLAKLFLSEGPVHWEIARQMAQWLAVEGRPEANVDPLERIRLDELVRVADLQVQAATGLSTSVTGRVLAATPVGRAQWALRSLTAYRGLFERLAARLTPTAETGEHSPDPTTELLGSIGSVLGPVLMGLQAGSMVGHLAQRAFAAHELPIPWPPSDEVVVVPANVTMFATEWGLPLDDLRLWVCLEEVVHHAVLGRPHVRVRVEDLLNRYVAGFRADPAGVQDKLTELDPTDPESFRAVLGDPEALLGAMQTDEQRRLLPHIEAVVAAVVGYADHVMETVGRRLIGSYGALHEALTRRRVERGESHRFVERMLGIELGQGQYDRGEAFVRGVLERAGEDGLSRLWRSARELPTPAEIAAPGLWLERIDLPD